MGQPRPSLTDCKLTPSYKLQTRSEGWPRVYRLSIFCIFRIFMYRIFSVPQSRNVTHGKKTGHGYIAYADSQSLNASNTSSSCTYGTNLSQLPNLHTFITSSLFNVLAVLALYRSLLLLNHRHHPL